MQQPKHLTIKGFHSPTGSVGQSKLIIDNLMTRYTTNISKNIELLVFKDKENYVFRISIPSEKNFRFKTNIFYDVIIEFYPIDKKQIDDTKIVDYGLRVFSNVPTFMFNFTYVYHKMNALYRKIPLAMYSEKALAEPTKQTNPYKLIGIEKSILYALRKIYEVTKYTKDKIDKILVKLPEEDPNYKFPGNIFDDIKSQEDKMKEILNTERVKLPRKSKIKKAGSAKVELKIGNKTIATGEAATSGRSLNMTSTLKENKLKADYESFKQSKLKANKLAGSRLGKKSK